MNMNMNMNMNMVILSGDRAGGLHREMSQCSAPPMSVKDRTVVGLPMFRDFATNHMLR
jgi:hypothetical protein